MQCFKNRIWLFVFFNQKRGILWYNKVNVGSKPTKTKRYVTIKIKQSVLLTFVYDKITFLVIVITITAKGLMCSKRFESITEFCKILQMVVVGNKRCFLTYLGDRVIKRVVMLCKTSSILDEVLHMTMAVCKMN